MSVSNTTKRVKDIRQNTSGYAMVIRRVFDGELAIPWF